MLRGEWESIGKEVGEGKERQMNQMQGSQWREGGEVGGGWRSGYGEGRGGEGVRRVRVKSGEGRGRGKRWRN